MRYDWRKEVKEKEEGEEIDEVQSGRESSGAAGGRKSQMNKVQKLKKDEGELVGRVKVEIDLVRQDKGERQVGVAKMEGRHQDKRLPLLRSLPYLLHIVVPLAPSPLSSPSFSPVLSTHGLLRLTLSSRRQPHNIFPSHLPTTTPTSPTSRNSLLSGICRTRNVL
ncbi:hypothetical protein Pmani_035708 [Petrolisthes manimaculis]|uniref:Uncharacterized protein n=1 Tax=Petrolisthes manimaculis TaxID=1843537 RepID=A0AAE1NL61_9EUCA|nr:hypothetical protein Pmani_035708 [Petrolisthes manimaculis]